MAYEVPTLDTSQRQKMMGMLDQFYNIPQYQQMLRSAGDQSLRRNFDAAQERIGAQFSPVQRMATARLGGSPLLADSGYANRLNRQIQTSAFGDLSRAYGQAASDQSQSQLSALERLIQARFGGVQQMFGNIQQKKKSNTGAMIGTGLGAVGGAFLGSPQGGAAVGGQLGGMF